MLQHSLKRKKFNHFFLFCALIKFILTNALKNSKFNYESNHVYAFSFQRKNTNLNCSISVTIEQNQHAIFCYLEIRVGITFYYTKMLIRPLFWMCTYKFWTYFINCDSWKYLGSNMCQMKLVISSISKTLVGMGKIFSFNKVTAKICFPIFKKPSEVQNIFIALVVLIKKLLVYHMTECYRVNHSGSSPRLWKTLWTTREGGHFLYEVLCPTWQLIRLVTSPSNNCEYNRDFSTSSQSGKNSWLNQRHEGVQSYRVL